jgi:hypothetical protein
VEWLELNEYIQQQAYMQSLKVELTVAPGAVFVDVRDGGWDHQLRSIRLRNGLA